MGWQMNETSANRLSEHVLAAFTLALSDENKSVADQLLRALEMLAAQQSDTVQLDRAYLLLWKSTQSAKRP